MQQALDKVSWREVGRSLKRRTAAQQRQQPASPAAADTPVPRGSGSGSMRSASYMLGLGTRDTIASRAVGQSMDGAAALAADGGAGGAAGRDRGSHVALMGGLDEGDDAMVGATAAALASDDAACAAQASVQPLQPNSLRQASVSSIHSLRSSASSYASPLNSSSMPLPPALATPGNASGSSAGSSVLGALQSLSARISSIGGGSSASGVMQSNSSYFSYLPEASLTLTNTMASTMDGTIDGTLDGTGGGGTVTSRQRSLVSGGATQSSGRFWSIIGFHNASKSSGTQHGDSIVQRGLRIRMGVASGLVPRSVNISRCALFELAKGALAQPPLRLNSHGLACAMHACMGLLACSPRCCRLAAALCISAVSDMANGGQIIIEEGCFGGVRDRLTELGTIDSKARKPPCRLCPSAPACMPVCECRCLPAVFACLLLRTAGLQ